MAIGGKPKFSDISQNDMPYLAELAVRCFPSIGLSMTSSEFFSVTLWKGMRGGCVRHSVFLLEPHNIYWETPAITRIFCNQTAF
jgi:hypothetical protein